MILICDFKLIFRRGEDYRQRYPPGRGKTSEVKLRRTKLLCTKFTLFLKTWHAIAVLGQKNRAFRCFCTRRPCLLKIQLLCGFSPYLFASSTATAQATVAPTIGLLPMPIRPIISTWAGTEEEPANWASPCMRPIESVKP